MQEYDSHRASKENRALPPLRFASGGQTESHDSQKGELLPLYPLPSVLLSHDNDESL